jgi:hypothetical protein
MESVQWDHATRGYDYRHFCCLSTTGHISTDKEKIWWQLDQFNIFLLSRWRWKGRVWLKNERAQSLVRHYRLFQLVANPNDVVQNSIAKFINCCNAKKLFLCAGCYRLVYAVVCQLCIETFDSNNFCPVIYCTNSQNYVPYKRFRPNTVSLNLHIIMRRTDRDVEATSSSSILIWGSVWGFPSII